MAPVRSYVDKRTLLEQVILSLNKACNGHQYVDHIITGYTAESGSTTSEAKLTLHLKSPAVQKAEAAALRAEEEETGWIVYNCCTVGAVEPDLQPLLPVAAA